MSVRGLEGRSRSCEAAGAAFRVFGIYTHAQLNTKRLTLWVSMYQLRRKGKEYVFHKLYIFIEPSRRLSPFSR